MAKKAATKKKKSKNITKITLDKLISKGKKKGFLTYDEINKALPDDTLSLEEIDETLIMLNDLDIEIIDEKKNKLTRVKKVKISATTATDTAGSYQRDIMQSEAKGQDVNVDERYAQGGADARDLFLWNQKRTGDQAQSLDLEAMLRARRIEDEERSQRMATALPTT